ncbi:MAG: acetyl-CoA carboxylase biotin carboxyl carrier protein subunit [Chloroflexi bacterium]|nr:acetyl-CoA carboxylase biotin carboxyl carrier protein subunit [Chloroflexota bacterium]
MPQERVDVPITGKIIAVNVTTGKKVEEGDVICTIESMKMENPILAPVGGKITEVKVSPGQVVQTGSLIAVIEY